MFGLSFVFFFWFFIGLDAELHHGGGGPQLFQIQVLLGLGLHLLLQYLAGRAGLAMANARSRGLDRVLLFAELSVCKRNIEEQEPRQCVTVSRSMLIYSIF